MRTYVVGGAVRDRLLGREIHDRDHVVVGSTPEAMVAAGFMPIGRDFPVFLDPVRKEEFALARTERKTGPGYAGFTFHTDPGVTLEEDLARRDLTINAMAEDEAGNIIDPYGGRRDLEARVLRHVGAAFVEDPVRILRLARFAARLADFSIAPETMDLMRSMVESGEVDALVPERVWQEWARGLMESAPARMLQVLNDCRALEHIAAPLAAAGAPWAGLRAAAAHGMPLSVRFAVWMSESSLSIPVLEDLCERLRVPAHCRELAEIVLREGPLLEAADQNSAGRLGWLERSDALRRPERFREALAAASIVAGEDPEEDARVKRFSRARAVVAALDAGAIARAAPAGTIPAALHAARLEALTRAGL